MSDELHPHQNKHALFEEWMQDDHVMVHVDSRPDSICVPEHLKTNPALTLKLSYRFRGSTVANEQEIRAQLLFGEQYFEVVIPWEHLWGMTSTDGVQKIWPESVPADVMRTYLVARLKELSKDPTADIPAETGEDSEKEARSRPQHDRDLKVEEDDTPSQKGEPHSRPALTITTTTESPPDDRKVQKLSRPILKRIK